MCFSPFHWRDDNVNAKYVAISADEVWALVSRELLKRYQIVEIYDALLAGKVFGACVKYFEVIDFVLAGTDEDCDLKGLMTMIV